MGCGSLRPLDLRIPPPIFTNQHSGLAKTECALRGIQTTENVNGILNTLNTYAQAEGGSGSSFTLATFKAVGDYVQGLYECVSIQTDVRNVIQTHLTYPHHSVYRYNSN